MKFFCVKSGRLPLLGKSKQRGHWSIFENRTGGQPVRIWVDDEDTHEDRVEKVR